MSTRRLILISAAITIVLAAGALTIFAPMRSEGIERAILIVDQACFFSFWIYFAAVQIPAIWKRRKPSKALTVRLLCMFAMIGLVIVFPWIGRNETRKLVQPAFDGTVVRAYRSDNHQAAAVEIRTSEGKTLMLEGIADPTWNALRPGARVSKAPWNPSMTIDGKPFAVVP